MSCYMVSLSCESSRVSSIHHNPWVPCYTWSWQMASSLWGSFHDSSNHVSQLQQVNGFSLVCVLSCIFKLLLSLLLLLCLVTWLLSLVKCLFTYWADKWLFSHVSLLMYLQLILSLNALYKWLLHCEDPFMIFQIPSCFKCLVTIAAGKWLLSCVSFRVSSNFYFL